VIDKIENKQKHGQTARRYAALRDNKDYKLMLFHIDDDIYSRFFPNFHLIVIQSLNLW